MTTRRTFTLGSVAVATALMPSLIAARQATPDAEAEPLPPDVIYESLLASTISSPLFPSDTPTPSIVVWDDSGDSDLEGAVGGLLVQTGPEDDDMIGAYIVHPTIDQASSRLTLDGEAAPLDLFGYPTLWSESVIEGFGEREDESYSMVVMQVGVVLISSYIAGEYPAQNSLRALANMTGLLDHLLSVVSPPTV